MEMIDPMVAFGRLLLIVLISLGILLALRVDKPKRRGYNDFSD